jgi:7,8-dihydropterin-6-yl-methyl-4-(beta-D-ribofuranosyl)aminobenzene 5'-phosphate synthase
MNHKIFIFMAILVLLGAGIFLIQTKKEPQSKVSFFREEKELKIEEEKGKVREVTLISVYDNYQVNPELKTAWGFGCAVKTSKELLLFDTGGNSEILLSNMEKMDIDPKSISKVIISHIHGDHIGGLKGFLEKNNNVTVFIPSSFPDSIRDMITNQGAEFVSVDRPRKISDFVYTTGELYGPPKEQSLIINSKKGLIVITGCAHPGVVNIVNKAKEIFPEEKVCLVLGGFHLGGVSDFKLKSIVSDFRKLGVEKVAPSHCSGDRCRELFKEEYKEDFIECGVGKMIEVATKSKLVLDVVSCLADFSGCQREGRRNTRELLLRGRERA